MNHSYRSHVVDLLRRDLSLVRSVARFLPPFPLIGFVLAMLLVLVDAMVSHRYVAAVATDVLLAHRDRVTVEELGTLQQSSAEALAAARGLLLTRDPHNLRAYAGAAARARAALSDLRESMPTLPGSELRTLDNVSDGHLVALDRLASLADAGVASSPPVARASSEADLSSVAVSLAAERERARLRDALVSHEGAIARQLRDAEIVNAVIAAATLTLLFGIGWLLVQYLQQRRRAEAALRHLNNRLEEAVATRTAQLTELSQHLLAVREEERAALARDIHDEIGSHVSAVMLDVKVIEGSCRRAGAVADTVWERLDAALQEITTAHRRIINSLHPTVLDHLGLPAAVDSLLADLRERNGIRAELEVEGEFGDLPKGLPIAIYRIVQEAITNVVRHAHATRVQAQLVRSGDVLRVSICDDGVGVDPDAGKRGRLGLVGMRERAHKLGGSVRIGRGRNDAGTCVAAEFDLARAATPPMP